MTREAYRSFRAQDLIGVSVFVWWSKMCLERQEVCMRWQSLEAATAALVSVLKSSMCIKLDSARH